MTIELTHWQLAEAPSGLATDPSSLLKADLRWNEAIVPGTVAMARGIRVTDPGLAETRLDSKDWWYRAQFSGPTDGASYKLCFDGLATLADVWLNGRLVLSSRNMFLAHAIDVTADLKASNELLIRFRSLEAELSAKKPRPRWKPALVSHQNLRWVRTTLLGRMPGWSPMIQAVGPWRAVRLERTPEFSVENLTIRTELRANSGVVHITGQLVGDVSRARLCIDGKHYPLKFEKNMIRDAVEVADAPQWWPHTHGDPALLDCALELDTSAGTLSLARRRIGFRSIEMNRDGGRVELRVNGAPIFCRGACWTTADMISLTGGASQLRRLLTTARDGGANMLRIGGTMVYESDTFYELCDELGILVWQDFMFANMDYPVKEPEFRSEIEREVVQQLDRLQKHPCIAVYCGGSEVQQQAAMMGLGSDFWSNDFFDHSLGELCASRHPGAPYFPSSPCEGALPFHVGSGVAHYYGVGAYRRPLTDVKHAGVKFAAECLGISNVPSREVIEEVAGGSGALPAPHHPLWKQRVPRDSGSGYDFEDIRDHYLRELFGVDPVTLRAQDLEQYYALSSRVSGHVMKTVFAEWRKPGSGCGGGLVWFFGDLWPGAGWGIVDSHGNPKPVWHALKAAWAPQALLITDEGVDGLNLHIINETAKELECIVELGLWNPVGQKTAAPPAKLALPPRGALTISADALIGGFTDLNAAYRFGPPKYEMIQAVLREARTGTLITEDRYYPSGLPPSPRTEQ